MGQKSEIVTTDTVIKSRYVVGDLLTEDLISYVYIGRTKDSDKAVLIWQYKSEYISTRLIPQLIRTAENIISVDHPNGLKMLDYFYDGALFFTIHEFEETLITLDSYLIQRPTLTYETVHLLISQIGEALVATHEQGVLQGFLNLNSIYVSDKLDVKVVNNAIAAKIYQKNFEIFSVVEECLFLAPEFLNHQELSNKSDVYSFGVILYFLMTGQWPYKYTPNVVKFKKALLKSPKKPNQINPKIPIERSRLIEWAISKDSDHRCGSVEEFMALYTGKKDITSVGEIEWKSSKVHKDITDKIRLNRAHALRETVINIMLVAVPIIVLISGYTIYMRYLTAIPKVTIPNVVGQTFDMAKLVMEQDNLSIQVAGNRYHPFIEEGVIIETKPPGGREVKQNRSIRVFVSKGTGKVAVPDIVGRTLDQARILVEQDGVKLTILGEEVAIIHPKNYIISQVPTPGTEIQIDEELEVVLSKGFPISLSTESDVHIPELFRRVKLHAWFLAEWDPVILTINSIYEGETTELYTEMHQGGEILDIDFEVPINSTMEVYFNNELGLKQKIEK
ncbi:PASTA domain-containing protein [bacterium]|jgi:eukaryotic-like serine/threonine-protein kinase|nr:PASTA domain-containing protein [bacterium]